MALPKILLGDGEVVLLSGFEKATGSSAVAAEIVDSEETPDQIERNLDACVFGWVAAGEWWPE